MEIYFPDEIENLIFYVSHSGGKDSQAMYALLKEVLLLTVEDHVGIKVTA